MNNLMYLYRLRDWRHKIAGLRVIAYPVFGYTLSGVFAPISQVGHLLAVLGVLITCYALNDYYDWQILKERNYLASRVSSGQLTSKKALLLCWAPLVLCLGLLLVDSWLVWILFVLMAFLVIGYSVPPLRFKHRRLIGTFVPPLGVGLVVLQAYLITGALNLQVLLLGLLLVLFQLYLEMMHILEDATIKEEYVKLPARRAWTYFRYLPAVSGVLAGLFSMLYPVFLISTGAAIIRVASLRRTTRSDIPKLRREPWRLQWSLYEFVLYTAAGILGVFSV